MAIQMIPDGHIICCLVGFSPCPRHSSSACEAAIILQQSLNDIAGDRWKESGPVPTSEVGSAMDHRNTQRRCACLCRRAALTRIRVYDLRHTAASLMVDAGADLKAASEALGHRDPRITMKIYRHVRGDQRARAITLLSEAITRPASKQETPPNRT